MPPHGEIEAAEAEASRPPAAPPTRPLRRGLAEAKRLIRENYPTAARAVVEILKRAEALRNAAIKANEALPADAERWTSSSNPNSTATIIAAVGH